ncbi:hypothetical protein PMAYCL1PPCAC_20251 [Pristionchus mayeri]|uniref:Uncharacterized protein n=1 Tax=Pristionchus mayeri TaxID=1317129 RepID=A0AAN5I403_9BILA|nr:hypothetical protein PMAYCL1PPCAC_20251 [Pristionchus mayeri]
MLYWRPETRSSDLRTIKRLIPIYLLQSLRVYILLIKFKNMYYLPSRYMRAEFIEKFVAESQSHSIHSKSGACDSFFKCTESGA